MSVTTTERGGGKYDNVNIKKKENISFFMIRGGNIAPFPVVHALEFSSDH